ncbi:ABC transporter permease [Kaistia dalseonensis]|uniref:ABC transporter permease n=1 Tax=Kaistia dalseonensis TaxID=410840 RepID=UPI00225C00D8|nr:ABC transporter permease [Kaistia dalseonensis]MCX5494386.1 ABC transporter permease [Kaistia dalseonensis]
MSRIVLRRFLSALVLMVFASIACFSIVTAFPGNVARVIAEMRSSTVSDEIVRQIEVEYGLNDPLPLRYLHWAGRALSGDLGESLRTGQPVAEALIERAPPTVTLIIGGGLFALVMGAGLAFLGALVPGSIFDRIIHVLSLVGASAPKFFVAALLIYTFGVAFRLLPTYGFGGPLSWILPCISIGIIPGSILSRVARVALAEEMSRQYVVTAISKGLSRRRILMHDAVPNALPVTINAFAMHFAFMVQAALVIEPIFAWPGIAAYFVEAVRFRDYQVLQSCLLVFCIFFILVNLSVDLISVTLDPKQRQKGLA